MSWTDERIAEARRVLGESRTVREAAERMGLGSDALEKAFRRRGHRASEWLGKSSATVTGSVPQHEPKPVVTIDAPGTVMGRIARRPVRLGEAKPGRYRVAHVTDIHFGSKHCDAKALLDFLKVAKDAGCDVVVCTGDVLDGTDERLVMEQRCVGFDDQAEEATEVIAGAPKFAWVVIGGNHDAKANDLAGVESGRVLEQRMREAGVEWHSLGSCLGRATIHGARWELYHPHGSGSTRNAVRRILNAKAEKYEPHDRPHVLATGHFHKWTCVATYPERVFCVGGGTFQRRESDFGVRMIHPWDIGGSIVSYTIADDGTPCEFAVEFYPVRSEARGWAA